MLAGRSSSGIQKSVIAYGSLVAIHGSSLAWPPRPRRGPLGVPHSTSAAPFPAGNPPLRPGDHPLRMVSPPSPPAAARAGGVRVWGALVTLGTDRRGVPHE